MDNSEVAAAIRRSPWFDGIPDTGLDALVEAAKVRTFPRGSFLFSAGETTTEVYGLLDGRIRLGMTSALGQEFAITDVGPGSWLGEQSLTSDHARVLDALVIEEARVVLIPVQLLRTLGENFPQLYKTLLKIHIDNTRKIYELLGGMLFYPLRTRLAGRLLQLVEQHGEPADGGVYLNVKLSQNDFARLSLGSRQRINKIFREWHRDDIIVMKKDKYFIKKLTELQKEIDLTAL